MRHAVMALAALILISAPALAEASSVMAVGQDEGYSGKVMDKIIAKWSPPPQLKREYKLKLRIALDGRGRLLECRPQRSSGFEAVDASACAAVKAAAPFGDPPYGMPAVVYLSFWTGSPQGRTPEDAKDPSRYIEDSDSAETRASAMNASAKAKAEQAAKSSGKPLPGQKAKAAAPAKAAPAPAPAQPPAAPAQAAPADIEFAQAKYDQKYAAYLKKAARQLRNSMYVPVQAAPGTYYATARISFDARGNISSASLLKESGDRLVDKYVLQGIKRAKRVPAPPPGLKSPLDLTFALTR